MDKWLLEDMREWQLKMLDKAAMDIANALKALPEEYANAHQNHAVGGNLHKAIGSLAAIRMTLKSGYEEKIRAREATSITEKDENQS